MQPTQGKRAAMYRWFGVGKMPPEVRATLESPILVEEGVRMTFRRNFTTGHRTRLGAVRLESGALAVLTGRVVIAFRGAVIDGTVVTDGSRAAGQLQIAPDTLEVTVDVGAFEGLGSGTLQILCKWPLSDAAREALPASGALHLVPCPRLTRMP